MNEQLTELLESVAALNIAIAATNAATIDLLLRLLSEPEPEPSLPLAEPHPYQSIGARAAALEGKVSEMG